MKRKSWLLSAIVLIIVALSGTWLVYNKAIAEAKSKSMPANNTSQRITTSLPPAIDNIACTSQPVVVHQHVLLTVYNNGQKVTIPAGIGLYGNTCAYWLHTHDTSGIIHIESPVKRSFTLGEFFDIWGQPLSKNIVGPFPSNSIIVYVNGRRFSGNPKDVELHNHDCITIEIGKTHVTPVTHFDFSSVE